MYLGGGGEFFFVEERGQFLEGGYSGFLEIVTINFTTQLLFDLLFMCRLKDVVCVLFHSHFELLLFY